MVAEGEPLKLGFAPDKNEAGRAQWHVGKIDPGLGIPHPRRIEFGPGFVGEPCEQAMVGGMPGGAELEKSLAARELVTGQAGAARPALHPPLARKPTDVAPGTATGAAPPRDSARNRRKAHQGRAPMNRPP